MAGAQSGPPFAEKFHRHQPCSHVIGKPGVHLLQTLGVGRTDKDRHARRAVGQHFEIVQIAIRGKIVDPQRQRGVAPALRDDRLARICVGNAANRGRQLLT